MSNVIMPLLDFTFTTMGSNNLAVGWRSLDDKCIYMGFYVVDCINI